VLGDVNRHMTQSSLHSREFVRQTASRLIQPFYRVHHGRDQQTDRHPMVAIARIAAVLDRSAESARWRSCVSPSDTWLLGPAECPPNGTSIGSAVLATPTLLPSPKNSMLYNAFQ